MANAHPQSAGAPASLPVAEVLAPPVTPEPIEKDVAKKGKSEKEKAPEKEKKVTKTPSSARSTPSAPAPAPVPQPPAVPSWHLKVYSVGSVRLAPDTRREDEISMIKSSWEAVEKGRAKSAKGLRAQHRHEMKEVPFDMTQVTDADHGTLISDDVIAKVCLAINDHCLSSA